MCTLPINLRKNIEEKWLDVKVQSLVIKEQFCKQAKVLTVQLQYSSHSHLFHKHAVHFTGLVVLSQMCILDIKFKKYYIWDIKSYE